MNTHLDRRAFFGVAGLTATTIPLSQLQAMAPPEPAPPLIRRNVNSKEAKADIDAYAKAVTEMKKLRANDPLSWEYQASIHRTACPHANWWFLPWHRAYLLYFEQICRKLSQKADFALPYWDWSTDQTIPAPFLDKTSPLYWQKRERDKLSKNRVGRAEVIVPTVLDEPNFLVMGSRQASRLRQSVASGALEQPHNYVHVTIGGDMGDPDTAALDPVFWVHHTFIDRVWAEWQTLHSSRLPTSATWQNTVMNFYTADGKSVRTSTSQLISTVDLGYDYDGLKRLVFGAGNQPRLFAETARPQYQAEVILEEGDASTLDPAGGKTVVTVKLAGLTDALQKRLARAATGDDSEELSIPLTLDDIQVDPEVNYGVRVFLNAPNPEKLPDVGSPNHVGTIDFFALKHAGGNHGAKGGSATTSAVLSLSRSLAAIGKEFDSKKPLMISCQVAPIGGAVAKGKVKFSTFRVEAVTATDR